MSGAQNPSHSQPYYGAEVCLLTQHQKQQVIGPVLRQALNITLTLDDGFDTDSLGNFTRTIDRALGQLDSAEKKARLAVARNDVGIGIGSEGSFDSRALGGLACLNTEVLVWFDANRELSVVGQHQTLVSVPTLFTADYGELVHYAMHSEFAEQALVLRADDETDPHPIRGIRSSAQLEQAFVSCLNRSSTQQVFAEWDLRAHCCPCRRLTIGKAAEDLAERLMTLCPQCGSPGYGVVRTEPGLPCRMCHLPTNRAKGQHYRCSRCKAGHLEPVREPYADPFDCPMCNP